ncbi:magnesium-translocating P-type ATPase [Corynebacterium sp. 335C]
MPAATRTEDRLARLAAMDPAAVHVELGAPAGGLDDEGVERMRHRHGRNAVGRRREDTVAHRLRRAFLNPFNGIVAAVALVSLVADVAQTSNPGGEGTTAAVILTMILVGGTIRLTQELRAKDASDQFNRLIDDDVDVRRDGRWKQVPARDLVVGDVVRLAAGDRVPADIVLTDVHDLYVSQASLTGESAIAEKTAAGSPAPADLAAAAPDDARAAIDGTAPDGAVAVPATAVPATAVDLPAVALMSTAVIGGRGEGVVAAVGDATVYGRAASPGSRPATAFHRGATSIAWVMLRFMAVLVPVVFILLGVAHGRWLTSLAFSLSIAVGLMPELLPMVVTACLAKGGLAMLRRRALVKDIDAMQGFGAMDVLCLDKAGTLTHASILLEYHMDVLGNEDARVLDLAYLNAAHHSGVRNPVDDAVLAVASRPGQRGRFAELERAHRKVDEIPFDYARSLVSVLVEDDGGGRSLVVKGDVREVVARCSHVAHRGGRIPVRGPGAPEDAAGSVAAVVDEMLDDGMKVIAVAEHDACGLDRLTLADERDLTLLGYLAFFDAPKDTAAASVAALGDLAVAPKVLTGDRAAVAANICRRVGIAADAVVTGARIDELDDGTLRDVVERRHVFAELAPAHKVRIIAALRGSGRTVGFLGDGINDIPALTEADVGISVDTAVDAAKDAADVVLLEKDLTVLADGIVEGRRTFANMQKYVSITAASNFGNILSVALASAFLPFLPMAAIQILLLNLVYDLLCIVLPWDSVDPEDVARPRGWSGARLTRFMLAFGPVSSVFDIATFAFLYHVLAPSVAGGATFHDIADPALRAAYVQAFQTGWFLESLWTQVLILLMLRTRKLPFIRSRPSAPVLATTLLGLVALTALTFTSAGSVVGLVVLPTWYLAFLLLVAAAYMLATTAVKQRVLRTAPAPDREVTF